MEPVEIVTPLRVLLPLYITPPLGGGEGTAGDRRAAENHLGPGTGGEDGSAGVGVIAREVEASPVVASMVPVLVVPLPGLSWRVTL